MLTCIITLRFVSSAISGNMLDGTDAQCMDRTLHLLVIYTQEQLHIKSTQAQSSSTIHCVSKTSHFVTCSCSTPVFYPLYDGPAFSVAPVKRQV